MKSSYTFVVATLRFVLASLGVVTAFWQGPASAQVSTSGAGPYYATPSWDQKITTGRFVVLSNWDNAAVLDRETGLVWERSPDASQGDWESAQMACINKNVSGRKGWKLPSLQELFSISDPTMFGPSLPAGHPFTNVQTFGYWSATANASFTNPPNAWVVNFSVSSSLSSAKTLALFYTWCVRGGPGLDAQ